MPLFTPNVRLARVALGCAVLAGCSSDRNSPLEPVSRPELQAADTSSATLRSGYMLSTGFTQPAPEETDQPQSRSQIEQREQLQQP